jgi:hypothetical protein
VPDRQSLAEAGTVTLTETTTAGTALVTLITPGRGSSGEYPAAVLEAAANDAVFPAGTHMYLDHPTPGERPERSLDRLAGVLTEAATWDGSALKAPAKIYPRFRSMLAEMQDDIGVSIRADGVIENGVVQSIGPVASVDFVTKAGRGGSFQLVESAVIVEGHGMTANDLSQAVSDAVRDTYGGQDTYTWVRDYTDEWAVFSIETPDSTDLFQQAYTVTDGVVTLTGDRTPVHQQTVFVPVAEADTATPIADAALEAVATETPATEAGQPASDPLPVPTQESQEDAMPELTEAEVQTLREAAEQLPTVTAERDAARAELAAHRRRDAARPIVTAALAEANISARTRTRVTEALVAAAPATDSGDLDEAALTAAIEAARTDAEAEAAELLAESGYGQVIGLGAGTTPLKESDAPSAEYAAIYGTEA